MFAMLTGTLPFTVEPFNIKQLHQKMVNGEISSIPTDVSKGNCTQNTYKNITSEHSLLAFIMAYTQMTLQGSSGAVLGVLCS